MAWFNELVAIAMDAVSQSSLGAVVALFFVAALTEVGVPFPFVIDGVLFVTSYQNGLVSDQLLRVILALVLGREVGAAIIYLLSRFLGNAFINWLGKRFPKLCDRMIWLNTWLGSRAPLAVAIARLTPGLLTPSSVAAGCIGIRYYYFALGVILASIIADGALIVFGFVTMHGLRFLGLAPSAWQVVGVLVAAVVLILVVRWFWWRRHPTKS